MEAEGGGVLAHGEVDLAQPADCQALPPLITTLPVYTAPLGYHQDNT